MIPIADIERFVEGKFGLAPGALRERTRRRAVTWPRGVLFYLARRSGHREAALAKEFHCAKGNVHNFVRRVFNYRCVNTWHAVFTPGIRDRKAPRRTPAETLRRHACARAKRNWLRKREHFLALGLTTRGTPRKYPQYQHLGKLTGPARDYARIKIKRALRVQRELTCHGKVRVRPRWEMMEAWRKFRAGLNLAEAA